MLKKYTVIIGLSLSLGLTACGQSSVAPKAEQAKPVLLETKPTPSEAEKSTKTKTPRANREGQAGREGRQRRKPAESAYAACDNLEVKSACSVETPRGTREGFCRVRAGDERAVCFPKRPEGGRNEGRRPRPSGQ